MSLRTKLLAIFAALGLLPLLASNAFSYMRSVAAVKQFVADQTAPIARRVAIRAGDELAIARGDLALLAGTSEIEQLIQPRSAALAIGARAYVDDAWRVVGPRFAWLEVQDARGRAIARWGDIGGSTHDDSAVARVRDATVVVEFPVGQGHTRRLGMLVAGLRLASLVPRDLLESHFGRTGYTLLTSIRGGANGIVNDGRRPGVTALEAATSGMTSGDINTVHEVTYTDHDTARVASVASVPGSSLLAISAGTPVEFASSFNSIRTTNLFLGLALTGALAIAFIMVTRRVTQPLELLTRAAADIGRGDFSPRLPARRNDEVGHLTAAIATMTTHIDRMMDEVEANRQMSAVGRFARQLSHEIRNPLTAMKLNLQSLERAARSGGIPQEHERTVEICLEEIQRLDRVVRGVLALGRTSPLPHTPLDIHALLSRAIGVVQPQLDAQGIRAQHDRACDGCQVLGDEGQLVGMFINLLINAAEAMPGGGCLNVAVARQPGGIARVEIRDSGAGVPAGDRERLFEPFYTTKVGGSGLGLSIAARDAERHHGSISLLEKEDEAAGAVFAVDLPILRTDRA